MSKRHASRAIHLSSLILLFFVVTFGLIYSSKPNKTAAEEGDRAVTGYAWSSNVGWTEFANNHSDPVVVKPFGANNRFEGYAWNSNVGWISFEPLNNGYGPAGEGDNFSARIFPTGEVKGWARACSVYESGCTFGSPLKGASDLGGWDGWIKMSGDWSNGVHLDGNELKGFAWAGLLGWIDFDGVVLEDGGGLSASCEIRDVRNGLEPVTGPIPAEPAWVIWSAVVSGGVEPYSYCWGNVCSPPLSPFGVVHGNTANIPNSGWVAYNNPGNYLGRFRVRDSGGTSIERECNLEVYDPDTQYELTLNATAISGASGSVSSNPPGISCTGVSENNGCNDSESFNAGSTVTLTATPNAGSTVSWTRDGLSVCLNLLACAVGMNEPHAVSAVFSATGNPGGGVTTINLITDPPIVRISQQSDGVPTSSVPRAVYSIESTNNDPAEVRVLSVKSKISGVTYELDPARSRCYLFPGLSADPGDPNDECSGPSAARYDLDANGILNFVVVIEDLDWPTLINSPYEVILQSCYPNAVGGTTCEEDKDLEFRYQPPNVEPE